MEIKNLNLQKQIDELKLLQDNWLDKVFPIGSIYKSVDNTNPEELFGGAWMSWGQGKVPVGVDSNDNDFNTVEKTGGEKIHTLTVNELPSHTHMLHLVSNQLGNGGGMWGTTYSQYDGNVDTYSTGNSQPHNNLQPYETLYMWKRVEPGYYLDWVDTDLISHSERFDTISEIQNLTRGTNSTVKSCKLSSAGMNKNVSFWNLFEHNDKIEIIDLSDFDFSKVTGIESAFARCNNLEIIIMGKNVGKIRTGSMSLAFVGDMNLHSIDSSIFCFKSLYMTSLFSGCSSLESLDLSKLDTSNTIEMRNMFNNCTSLVSLDLSKFNTKNVTTMSYMFAGCSSLKSLDLSTFDTSNVTDMNGMFSACSSLSMLDLSSFDFSKVTDYDYMFDAPAGDFPKDCLIYVKDQAAKDFVLKVRYNLTNVQIKS